MAAKKTARKNPDEKAGISEEEALEKLKKELEKEYGSGTLIKLGERPAAFPHYSTGILALDQAIGIGGFPKGRIVEIYGPESAGKTMLTLQAIAAVQKEGGRCAFIDAEQAINVEFAQKIGVQVDKLYLVQPESGEQGLDILLKLVSSALFDLIVVDSVAALVPQAELDGEMTELQVGAQARMMSKGLRKSVSAISRTNTTVIFINQLRMKIGVMWGNPEVTTGGNALKFYASLRLDVRKKEPIKENGEVVGHSIQVRVVKNKLAAPFKTALFDLMFDSGVSYEGQILQIAEENGLVKKSGAWYSIDGEKMGQGKEAAKKWLQDNPERAAELEVQVKKKIGIIENDEIDQTISQTLPEEISEEDELLNVDFDLDEEDAS